MVIRKDTKMEQNESLWVSLSRYMTYAQPATLDIVDDWKPSVLYV
jgi:hypothetical protein